MRTTLQITGMHCASCALIIEKRLKKTPGVSIALVNYGTEKATVEFDEKTTTRDALIKKVQETGYGVTDKDQEKIKEEEIKELKKLFFIGLIFSIPIVILSFPEFFKIDFSWRNIITLLLTIPVQFYVGQRFYQSAYAALKVKTANMDSLIVIGTTAAFAYSTLVTIFPSTFTGGTYFDTAAVIITFIMLGKWLELKAKGKTSEAIKKLIGLQPKTALVIRNGKEISISIEDVKVNDIIVVKPGQKIPVDVIVIKGDSSVDESM